MLSDNRYRRFLIPFYFIMFFNSFCPLKDSKAWQLSLNICRSEENVHKFQNCFHKLLLAVAYLTYALLHYTQPLKEFCCYDTHRFILATTNPYLSFNQFSAYTYNQFSFCFMFSQIVPFNDIY